MSKENLGLIPLTGEQFDETINKDLVVVKFGAEWCQPCKVLEKNITDLGIYSVDVDEEQELLARFGIRGVPVLIFFKHGKEVDRVVGVVSREYVTGLIATYA